MVIPAGSIVHVHFFAMFRSDWISNAETYDPDRWLDTNSQLPQLKEMFIPFSAGKRTCVGQNMAMLQLRVITAYFIRYFDFELVEEPVKLFFVNLKPASMMMKVRKAY
jgi:cytochrome P450